MRSENRPEKAFNTLAVDSATPSIRPSIDIGAPRTLVKNMGIIGYNISDEMSVKKLVTLKTMMFLFR